MRPACFPEFLAIVNPIKAQAFAMHFLQEEKYVNEVPLYPGEDRAAGTILGKGPREWSPRWKWVQNVLHMETHCGITDAVLVVRPYFKLLSGKMKPKGNVWLAMDCEIVLNEPLEEYGWGKKAEQPILPKPGNDLFYACVLNSEGQADPSLGIYGMMLPNRSMIEMDLGCSDRVKGVKLEVGLIAATYTTKAYAKGEKCEPRDLEQWRKLGGPIAD